MSRRNPFESDADEETTDDDDDDNNDSLVSSSISPARENPFFASPGETAPITATEQRSQNSSHSAKKGNPFMASSSQPPTVQASHHQSPRAPVQDTRARGDSETMLASRTHALPPPQNPFAETEQRLHEPGNPFTATTATTAPPVPNKEQPPPRQAVESSSTTQPRHQPRLQASAKTSADGLFEDNCDDALIFGRKADAANTDCRQPATSTSARVVAAPGENATISSADRHGGRALASTSDDYEDIAEELSYAQKVVEHLRAENRLLKQNLQDMQTRLNEKAHTPYNTVLGLHRGHNIRLGHFRSITAKQELARHCNTWARGSSAAIVSDFLFNTLDGRPKEDIFKQHMNMTKQYLNFLRARHEWEKMHSIARQTGLHEVANEALFRFILATKKPEEQINRINNAILDMKKCGQDAHISNLQQMLRLLSMQMAMDKHDQKTALSSVNAANAPSSSLSSSSLSSAQRSTLASMLSFSSDSSKALTDSDAKKQQQQQQQRPSLLFTSAATTVFYACLYHFSEKEGSVGAYSSVTKALQMDPRQIQSATIRALAQKKAWEKIEELVTTKTLFRATKIAPKTSPHTIASILHKYHAPAEMVESFILLVKPVERRLALAKHTRAHNTVIKILSEQKDAAGLRKYALAEDVKATIYGNKIYMALRDPNNAKWAN